jgi:RHS repeat-associated protein
VVEGDATGLAHGLFPQPGPPPLPDLIGTFYTIVWPAGVDPATGTLAHNNPCEPTSRLLFAGYYYMPPVAGTMVQPPAGGTGPHGQQPGGNHHGDYYCWNRVYAQKNGVWTTPDPGVSQHANLLDFVSGNPLNRADPSGLVEGRIEHNWDDFVDSFLKKHPDFTAKQKEWVKKQMARGCVGITAAYIGKAESHKDCYKTKADAEIRKSSMEMKRGGGGCSAPYQECMHAQIFSIHLWNDTGKDGTNKDVSFDANGKADLSNWDMKPRPSEPGRSFVNFDYGLLRDDGKILHADQYHNPDKDGDGKGDYWPDKGIRTAKVFESTLEKWQESYADFNTEVWCVQCKDNADYGDPAAGSCHVLIMLMILAVIALFAYIHGKEDAARQ